MSNRYYFKWTFTPADFFEHGVEILRDDYKLIIGPGQAEASVEEETYESNPEIRETINQNLNDWLLGAQIASFRAYELSDPTKTLVHADGQLGLFIEPKPGLFELSGYAPRIQIKTPDGSVVYDSGRDQFDHTSRLSELVAAHKSNDETLASLVRSYDRAVRDPQNELVHLYEIRDALAARFGGKVGALAATNISASHWSRLGQLCNDQPLRQGRHRGKTGFALREATEAELREAREIARSMLELYLTRKTQFVTW